MSRKESHAQPPRPSRLSQRWHSDEGRVTVFVVVLTTAILALAGLTLDGGLGLAAKVKANGQAEAAARAGAQAIDPAVYRNTGEMRLDPVHAIADAQSYLTSVDAAGTAAVSGNTVIVTVTATRSTQLLGLVGIPSLTVHGTGSAHPQRGVVAIEP